jgi:hypothetical protein
MCVCETRRTLQTHARHHIIIIIIIIIIIVIALEIIGGTEIGDARRHHHHHHPQASIKSTCRRRRRSDVRAALPERLTTHPPLSFPRFTHTLLEARRLCVGAAGQSIS